MENLTLTSLTTTEIRQLFRDELLDFFTGPNFTDILKSHGIGQDQVFDIPGLADYLKCSVQTVHNLKKEGAIPYYRLGRQVYFKKSEIDLVARAENILEKIIG